MITTKKIHNDYAFYSRVLNKAFDSVEELKEAEAAYKAEQKAKEDKAAAKKADATKVEVAYKELNAARKAYKEDLLHMTEAYQKALATLKSDFESDKVKIQKALSDAEAGYAAALKEFTDKHPEGYHITLRDGDFETTISSNRNATKKEVSSMQDIIDLLFGF